MRNYVQCVNIMLFIFTIFMEECWKTTKESEIKKIKIMSDKKRIESLDLTCTAKTTEEIKVVLGYPDIYVNTRIRSVQCSNCGRDGHSLEQCKVPTMDKLFAMFGTSLFDTTPSAIDTKRRIINDILGGK